MAANLEVNTNMLVVEMSHMNVSSNIVQKDACARCTAYTFASYSIYMLKTRAKTDGKKSGPSAPPTNIPPRPSIQAEFPASIKTLKAFLFPEFLPGGQHSVCVASSELRYASELHPHLRVLKHFSVANQKSLLKKVRISNTPDREREREIENENERESIYSTLITSTGFVKQAAMASMITPGRNFFVAPVSAWLNATSLNAAEGHC